MQSIVKLLGGADADHSQIIGEMQLNYWGDISLPFPLGFGTPARYTLGRDTASIMKDLITYGIPA